MAGLSCDTQWKGGSAGTQSPKCRHRVWCPLTIPFYLVHEFKNVICGRVRVRMARDMILGSVNNRRKDNLQEKKSLGSGDSTVYGGYGWSLKIQTNLSERPFLKGGCVDSEQGDIHRTVAMRRS